MQIESPFSTKVYQSINHFHSVVIGALIGKQSGRNVEVMNSFELKFKLINEDVIICQDYYRTKEEQCELLKYFLHVLALFVYFDSLTD